MAEITEGTLFRTDIRNVAVTKLDEFNLSIHRLKCKTAPVIKLLAHIHWSSIPGTVVPEIKKELNQDNNNVILKLVSSTSKLHGVWNQAGRRIKTMSTSNKTGSSCCHWVSLVFYDDHDSIEHSCKAPRSRNPSIVTVQIKLGANAYSTMKPSHWKMLSRTSTCASGGRFAKKDKKLDGTKTCLLQQIDEENKPGSRTRKSDGRKARSHHIAEKSLTWLYNLPQEQKELLKRSKEKAKRSKYGRCEHTKL
ncbi:hypothetical protein B9Z55_026538 [Caenorhabditis nigoni]|nr:hypothetical protein B9Z55_026538 [Caenorhabditis nigoni]